MCVRFCEILPGQLLVLFKRERARKQKAQWLTILTLHLSIPLSLSFIMNTLDILLLLLDLIFFSLLLRSIIIVFWSSNMSRVYAFDYSSATP